MQSGYIRIVVNKDAADKLDEVIGRIREHPEKGRHTEFIVSHLTDVSRTINHSYFIEPTIRMGASASTIRSAERATEAGVKVQATLLRRVFARLSAESLLRIADLTEIRTPVFEDNTWFLKTPVEQELIDLAESVVTSIRSEHMHQHCIDGLTELAGQSVKAIIDYYFLEPLIEMEAREYLIKIVGWASRIWLTLHSYEVRRLHKMLSYDQMLIYAEIIEDQVRASSH